MDAPEQCTWTAYPFLRLVAVKLQFTGTVWEQLELLGET